MRLSLGLLAALPAMASAASGNMNGVYQVASGGGKQDVPWNDDYLSKGYEYFDVWAPEIATHYGQVFWTDQHNQPIPPEIVKRFANKTMAIMGYEQDQVMVNPVGQPGVNPTEDVSVPINWAYNHHYECYMTGAHSTMAKVRRDPNDALIHGSYDRWATADLPSAAGRADTSIPTGQFFSEGNGGESRKSLHGYPAGFAQLIESPSTWHITPMQIDTRNRDCGSTPESINNCTRFTPGVEPKQARYGRGIPPGTNYSGVLECPCNGNFGGDPIWYGEKTPTKATVHNFEAQSTSCPSDQELLTAAACFSAAPSLGFEASKFANQTVDDPKQPGGCSVTTHTNGTATAIFNTAAKPASCSNPATRTGKVATSVGTTLALELDNSGNGTAEITVSGPSTVWFAVGLDAQLMCDNPYTLVVSGDGVAEHQLGTCGDEGCHCDGTVLASSVKVISNTVSAGVRTVVVSRPFKGLTSKHYSFSATQNTLPFIAAIGTSETFGVHAARTAAVITTTHTEHPTCVCDTGAVGSMCDNEGGSCSTFVKNCAPPPAGDLLVQKNPTCNSRQYGGGLRCCTHGRIMLDPDQEVRPELLRYHMKFRFWFQEYTPASSASSSSPVGAIAAKASHQDLPRYYYQTESFAGEYDIPPAFALPDLPVVGYPGWPLDTPTPGTTCTGTCPGGADCECIHTITYKFTVPQVRLIFAGGHCHAPSCLSMELYHNKSGVLELLCAQIPVYGKGNLLEDKYDEAGYLALPPCLWGDDDGLEPSILLPKGSQLYSIKKNRNTHTGHFGEMASWQMRGTPT